MNADIYKWVDDSGKVHFSDKVQQNHQVEKIELKINSYQGVTYEPYQQDVGNDSEQESSKRVTMFSTSWCGYCKKARKYFNLNAIPFVEYDIENNQHAKKRYDSLGGRGVPLILVSNRRMNGFSESGFLQIYR
ncbi:MAG: glutaredoxin domain-containing protein [Methylophagaceae bacterium]